MGDNYIVKTIRNILLSLLVLCYSPAPASGQDPYRDITTHTLSNGLTVVLSPNQNAKNLNVRARVHVGRITEDRHNLGVSHLLEHLLFRDSKFEEGQTYKEIINDAGGAVNAYIRLDKTVYYSSIPFSKGDWLVAQFAKMLFENTVDDEDMKRAKSSVELEIGEPSWHAEFLGFDIFASLFGRYFPSMKFLESEFGVRFPIYSKNEYRLSNRRLTTRQIEEQYSLYYRPSNTVLFIAGNFVPEDMMKLVENSYGKYDDGPGKTIPVLNPVPKETPYQRVEFEPDGQHYIVAGTKTLNLNARERVVLDAYLEHVAHRLMINLRNKYGETYTAQSRSFEVYGAGYGTVGFETQSEELDKNFEHIQTLIEEEARNGNLPDETIAEAVSLTKKLKYELTDIDADSMLYLAEDYYDFMMDYKTTDSPYAVLTSISPDEFRMSLKNIFLPHRSYTKLYIPYMYSKIEFFLLLLVSIIAAIITMRGIFRKSRIDETNIRWMTKANVSPGMLIEIVMMFLGSIFIFHLIFTPINRYVEGAYWYNTLRLWPIYIDAFLSIFIFVVILTSFLTLLPRKLLIEGNGFVIKSAAHYVRKFELSSIKSVRPISWFKIAISPHIWFSMRFRWFYNPLFFWRKGILLEIGNGPTYFIGVKNADRAVSEINQVINAKSETDASSRNSLEAHFPATGTCYSDREAG